MSHRHLESRWDAKALFGWCNIQANGKPGFF